MAYPIISHMVRFGTTYLRNLFSKLLKTKISLKKPKILYKFTIFTLSKQGGQVWVKQILIAHKQLLLRQLPTIIVKVCIFLHLLRNNISGSEVFKWQKH